MDAKGRKIHMEGVCSLGLVCSCIESDLFHCALVAHCSIESAQ